MDPLKFIKENCQQKFVSDNCLYLIRAGSKSYGTNIASSDEDFKGICVAEKKHYMGFKHRFEQYEHNDPDIVVFELTKWAQLLLNCNPNTIENLFVDPEDIIYIHPVFQKLLDIRDLALSKNVFNSFSGYAHGQMRKMSLHKAHFDSNPVKPHPDDYGIVESTEFKNLYNLVRAEVQKEVDTSLFNDFQNNAAMTYRFHQVLTEWKLAKDEIWASHLKRFVGQEDIYKQILQYKAYQKDLLTYKKYEDWKKNRNPKRAADEEIHKVDLKFAYHIIRLQVMCKEILNDHKVIVKRKHDKDLYLDIRAGKYSYEEIVEMSDQLKKDCETAYKTTTLPAQPDYEKFDKVVTEIVDELTK